ncbi:MAG: GatB/YqeY domain-containing protein [Lachnospiraceae bacterium]|nr:GatB/YqeY domain-containing protein [Lachnospiraceae bacterium]MBP3458549.1 GatB/YqeY domain-containing protein [Lachnospiraceae bacterium]
MTKIDFIRGEMVKAMKAHDKQRKDVLSMLLTGLKNVQIDKRADLTEEEENQVILKQIKQAKETLEMTPADRTDIIEECKFTIKVLEEYAPKMMEEAEIKTVIEEVLAELEIVEPTPQEKGKIMKILMPKVKGKADGKLVNSVLGSMMK